MKKLFLILGIASLICWQIFSNICFAESNQKIGTGKKVSIEYLVRLADGTTVDSNVGKTPLTYIQGNGEIIPGLERQLEGLTAGDARKVEVSPKEGYGEYNSAAVQEIPRNSINPDGLSVGATLYSQDKYGRTITAVVKEIKKDSIVLDLNHPLAGKMLYFDVKILKVE